MVILGIESSCDETAAAILQKRRGRGFDVLSNIISSQIDIHKKYGGVIPEVAAREHIANIIPVIKEALDQAGKKSSEIDLISVTKGPGLVSSLMVGLESAKSLAMAWKKPLVGTNHIEGHIYSAFIEPKNRIQFPALILTVSGGHTNLVLMKGHHKYQIIGETRDDAAGEAFDKGAKMLNLGYPGGPAISKEAEKFASLGKESSIVLPRPMLGSNDFDFSFSGLKTALLYQLQKDKHWKKRVAEYAFSYQEAITDILVKKTMKAAAKYKPKSAILSGGVSANKHLREKMILETKKNKLPLYIPAFKYTTDNAAMIAAAGYYLYKSTAKKLPWQKTKVDVNFKL
jgi:N6-L-threonylcarbamoyladenine synthase